jgi:hypothetical protein
MTSCELVEIYGYHWRGNGTPGQIFNTCSRKDDSIKRERDIKTKNTRNQKSKTILEGKILEMFNLNGFRGECRQVKGGHHRKAKTQTSCF